MRRLHLGCSILIGSFLLFFSPLPVDAGYVIRMDRALQLLEKEGAMRHIPWVKHRVAVFTYEDPEATGLGDDIASIVAGEILFNSGVSSLGVLIFKEDLSPDDSSSLSYFDKVDKITEKEKVTFSVWGRVLPVGDNLLIDTFVQLPPEVLDRHFLWKLRLPRAMGGRELQVHLRPDRIRLQRLSINKSAGSKIASAAHNLRILRQDPRDDATVLAEIPEERVYSVIQRQGEWVFLKVEDGLEGWIRVRGHCTGSCGPLIEPGQFAGGLLQHVATGRLRNATDNLTREALAVEEQIKALDALNSVLSEEIYNKSLERALRWTGPSRWTGIDEWTKIDRGSGTPPGGATFANIRAMAELAIKLHHAYETKCRRGFSRGFLESSICGALRAKPGTPDVEQLCLIVHELLRRYPPNLSQYDIQRFLGNDLRIELREFETNYHLDYSELLAEIGRALARLQFDDIRLGRQDVRPIAVELAKASLEDPNNVDVLKNLAVLFDFLGDTHRANIAGSLAESIVSEE